MYVLLELLPPLWVRASQLPPLACAKRSELTAVEKLLPVSANQVRAQHLGK